MKEEKYSILYVTGDGDKDEVRNFTARRNASIFPHEMREKII